MALAAAAILAGCSKNEQENVDGFTPKQIKFTNLNDKIDPCRKRWERSLPGLCGLEWRDGLVYQRSGKRKRCPQRRPLLLARFRQCGFLRMGSGRRCGDRAYPALSIAYEVPANANKDFTIAAPQLGLTSGTVGLAFSHMLAKITVTAQLHDDLSDAGYQLSTTGLTASLDVQSTGGTIDPTATTPRMGLS